MEKFDIDKIGREMPYKLPSEDFFDTFSGRLFADLDPSAIKPISRYRYSRRKRLTRQLYAAIGVAATVVIAVITLHKVNHSGSELGYAIKDDIVDSIDSYLTTLSDEELSELSVERDYQLDFYQNLPNYQ